MGKKSKLKQIRREYQNSEIQKIQNQQSGLEKFLFWLIGIAAGLALACPLVFKTQYYFPYVGPKSWYFFACCELMFFLWLTLAFYYKQYRPRPGKILIAFAFFLFIFILSGALGVDPSRSFWSKYERMTGILMWLHLFGFFLALSSTFKKLSQWKKFFLVSIIVSAIVCVLFLLIEFGGAWYERTTQKSISGLFPFARGGGATLGNSSFLGSYVLFNVFFACYLFFTQKKNWAKILLALFAIAGVFVLYRSGARAAFLSALGGFYLSLLIFWSFFPSSKKLKRAGQVVLACSVLTGITAFVLLFIPGSPVHNQFVKLASKARFVNWEMAWKGFLERPFLGWGPENYDLLFPKYFNPCLFTKECGNEIWFDRTHNIVLDALSQTGLLGLLAYLGLFIAFFAVLFKRFFKDKNLDLRLFVLFCALPVAYFVQNLTVFDMVASLSMFVFLLSFGAFLEKENSRRLQPEKIFAIKRKWVSVVFVFLFLIVFWQFSFNSAKTDHLVISGVRTVPSGDVLEKIKNEQGVEVFADFLTKNSQERVPLYEQSLQTSSLGKYQIRDFFLETSQGLIRETAKYFPPEQGQKELDFLAGELEKSVKTSPFDYRSVLKLAQTYNLYVVFGIDKLGLAEQYGQAAMGLSPTNQQSFWTLAQTKLYQEKFSEALSLCEKAIELEPGFVRSYTIAYQMAKFAQDTQKQEEIKQKALAVDPNWSSEFE